MKGIYRKEEIVFEAKAIVIDNKIKVKLSQIKWMEYTKKNLLNYLLIDGGGRPGYLIIELYEKIDKRDRFLVKLDYADVLKLPEEILCRIAGLPFLI